MNEVLLLKRTKQDADDGMFACFCGVINCEDYQEDIATFGEQRKAENFVHSFLRRTNKSVSDYDSTEEVITDFLNYCQQVLLEDVKHE